MLITVRLRLRDKHRASLSRQARSVNVVWNYCNETQQKAAKAQRNWLTAFDLMKLTAGSSKALGLHAHTIQRVCKRYAEARIAQRRAWLRFRGRKSLGWVPFNSGHVKWDGEVFCFNGMSYEPMHVRDLLCLGMRFKAGAFSQDSRGRWYINVPVNISEDAELPGGAVGVDLGLKSLLTTSDGEKIEAPRFYRQSEQALSLAQRARKTKRAKVIQRKAAQRRSDYLHKVSRALADQYGTIIVGGVSPRKLSQTRFAKSVHDAGWASFKNMLSYKSMGNGGRLIEVNEAMTSQTCSCCGAKPPERPTGIAGLGIREWNCSACGAVHDRDVNAAKNILRVGLDTLAEGAAQ